MHLIDDDALVLDSSPFRDRHLVVAMLTREHGLLRGVLRRARGGKQPQGAAIQVMSLVRINAHQRANAEMATFRGVDLLRSSFALASDLRASSAAAVVAELLITFCPLAEPAPRRYRLGVAALDALLSGVDAGTAVGYVQLWILELSGVMPAISRCSVCGEPGSALSAFNGTDGQPLCGSCASPGHHPLSMHDVGFLATCKGTPLTGLGMVIPAGAAAWLDRLTQIEADRPLRALDFYRRHVEVGSV